MANFVPVKNLKCPVCGQSMFHDELLKQKIYYCGKPNDEFELNGHKYYVRCGHIQAYCKKCNKILDESCFGKHNDAYECKKCGTVNWPLTDYYARNDKMRQMVSSLKK